MLLDRWGLWGEHEGFNGDHLALHSQLRQVVTRTADGKLCEKLVRVSDPVRGLKTARKIPGKWYDICGGELATNPK